VEAVGPSILRFDSLGRLLWANTYEIGQQIKFTALSPDGDGMAAAGNRYSNEGQGRKRRSEAFLLRIDVRGEVEWGKTMRAGARQTIAGALVSVTPGRLALAVNQSLAIFQDDELREVLDIELGGEPFDIFWATLAGKQLILAGEIGRQDARGIDADIVSLDASLAVAWTAELDVGANDRLSNVSGSADGSVWLTGSVIRMGPTLEDPVHQPEAWLVHLDQAGRVIESIATGPQDGNAYFGDGSALANAAVAIGSFHAGKRFRSVIAFHSIRGADGETCTTVNAAPVRILRSEAHVALGSMSASSLRVRATAFAPAITEIMPRLNPLCPD
jgi:hypothetical protein